MKKVIPNLSLKIFIQVIVLFALFSCKNIRIEGPAESYLPAETTSAISELPVTIEVDVAKLEQALNNNMKGLLYQGDNLSGRDLSVKIWKADDFSFFVFNNEITYKLPLKVWSRFGWSARDIGIDLGDRYEAQGVISLVYKTVISFDKQWNLIPKTRSAGYQWLVKPTVKAAGISIPVTPVADIAISFFEKSINGQIDKILSDQVNLRQHVSKAWDELQKPLLISDTNNIWLKISPSGLIMTPLVTRGGKLIVSMALSGMVESFVGAFPSEKENIPLPELKFAERAPGEFNINISADVTYDKITEIAKKELLGVNYHQDGKIYRVEDLALYSSQGRAVLALQLAGSYKGKIFLTGRIVHNTETNSLEIADPDFDINTKNALLKSAEWLLHGKILRMIKPLLNYPLESDLSYALDEANKMLDGYVVTPGISLSGKLDTLSVKGINMVPGAVRVEANLKGKLKVQVGEI